MTNLLVGHIICIHILLSSTNLWTGFHENYSMACLSSVRKKIFRLAYELVVISKYIFFNANKQVCIWN